MLAQRTGQPVLAISDAEAAGMLTAAQNVLRHYSVPATQKAADWAALAIALGGVYGPRVAVMLTARRKPHVEPPPFAVANGGGLDPAGYAAH